MKALVLADLHARTTGRVFPVGELPVDEHDVVVSLGDVIDESRDHAESTADGERYEERGRALFERLDECGVPVVTVPGNHDPLACTRRQTADLGNVRVVHGDGVNASSFDGVDADFGGFSIVGWGCEQFDFSPALPAPDYPDVPGVGSDGDASPADAIAAGVERAAGRYLAGVDSTAELARRLGVSDEHEAVRESVRTLERRFETLVAAIESASDPALVATHVSPFDVSFDRRGRHSHDGGYHFGSLALKLALRETAPTGALSGHTHQRGYDTVRGADGYAYVYNPGAYDSGSGDASGGVASLTVDAAGTFRVERVSVG